MNKRMKDPKGDLRFVHKSTRVYDFWSLKLTAMACRRQGTTFLILDTSYLILFPNNLHFPNTTLYLLSK